MSVLGLKDKQISALVDPFKADCVVRFSTWCDKRYSGWYYSGDIEFKNGMTEGKQEFVADNYGALLRKMERFVEELNSVS